MQNIRLNTGLLLCAEIFLTFLLYRYLPVSADYAIFAEMNNKQILLNSLHMKTHRVVKAALWVLVFITAILNQACGSDTEFRINGIIDNFGTGNLRLVYYSRDAVQSVTATAIDGKFMALARTGKPTVIRVYTSAGKLLGRIIIDNGQTVDIRLNATDPTDMTAEGNNDSKRLAEFLKNNAVAIKNHDTKTLNLAIGQIVQKNPKWVLSSLLMSDFYQYADNPHEALKLIASLDPDIARNTGVMPVRDMLLPMSHPMDSLHIDTLRIFTSDNKLSTIRTNRYGNTLLMFTDKDIRKSDSIKSALSILYRKNKLGIVDISADMDTAVWHNSIRELPEKDPENLTRAWSISPYTLPELTDIPVPSLPWFILTDSTGTLIYRGKSISRVRSILMD